MLFSLLLHGKKKRETEEQKWEVQLQTLEGAVLFSTQGTEYIM